MPTATSNYGLSKPLVNNVTDQDLWGNELNDDLDDLDVLLKVGINFTPSAKVASFSVDAPTAGSPVTGSSKMLFLCDATGGNITASLPAASDCSGMTIALKKTDSSANAVTIDGNGSETIDGALTLTLSTQYAYAILECDGTGWNVISQTGFVNGSALANGTTATTQSQGDNSTKVATTAYVDTATSNVAAHALSAYANFLGSNGTINKSYNVSSVTKTGTGQYTVAFTNPMPDAFYVVTFGGEAVNPNGFGTFDIGIRTHAVAKTVNGFSMTSSTNGAFADYTALNFMVRG